VGLYNLRNENREFRNGIFGFFLNRFRNLVYDYGIKGIWPSRNEKIKEKN
jgi:hypothetical protein